jgi:hypothetical protein
MSKFCSSKRIVDSKLKEIAFNDEDFCGVSKEKVRFTIEVIGDTIISTKVKSGLKQHETSHCCYFRVRN